MKEWGQACYSAGQAPPGGVLRVCCVPPTSKEAFVSVPYPGMKCLHWSGVTICGPCVGQPPWDQASTTFGCQESTYIFEKPFGLLPRLSGHAFVVHVC